MIPKNCGDIIWCVVFDCPESMLESSGNKDEINTDVPINAPPAINKMVNISDFILKPTPNDMKNSNIEKPPNIMPRSFAVSGKKPCPLFSLAIPASAIYTTNKINAIITNISDIIFLIVYPNFIRLKDI